MYSEPSECPQKPPRSHPQKPPALPPRTPDSPTQSGGSPSKRRAAFCRGRKFSVSRHKKQSHRKKIRASRQKPRRGPFANAPRPQSWAMPPTTGSEGQSTAIGSHTDSISTELTCGSGVPLHNGECLANTTFVVSAAAPPVSSLPDPSLPHKILHEPCLAAKSIASPPVPGSHARPASLARIVIAGLFVVVVSPCSSSCSCSRFSS